MGGFLGPLLRTGLSLIENVLKPLLAKSVLIAVSTTDAAIQRKIFGSGITTLVYPNEDLNIMKIDRFLKDAGFLIKGVSEIIENEPKEQVWISRHVARYIRSYFIRKSF